MLVRLKPKADDRRGCCFVREGTELDSRSSPSNSDGCFIHVDWRLGLSSNALPQLGPIQISSEWVSIDHVLDEGEPEVPEKPLRIQRSERSNEVVLVPPEGRG